ncbi:MAG: Cytidine deaminase [Candidatus Aminicenantes bacterium ADurb.Bin508]|nr:MAG: Cytidine deaminase [Candidatus Aminicenantes bacterium ADurb.Bin508]
MENASYGLTICAERNAVFQMVAAGEDQIAAILIAGPTEEFLVPCGACRQVIAEFASPETPVYMCDVGGNSRRSTMGELLPYRFSLNS